MQIGWAVFLIGLALLIGLLAGMFVLSLFCLNCKNQRDEFERKYQSAKIFIGELEADKINLQEERERMRLELTRISQLCKNMEVREKNLKGHLNQYKNKYNVLQKDYEKMEKIHAGLLKKEI